jgi:hypothetical protein
VRIFGSAFCHTRKKTADFFEKIGILLIKPVFLDCQNLFWHGGVERLRFMKLPMLLAMPPFPQKRHKNTAMFKK